MSKRRKYISDKEFENLKENSSKHFKKIELDEKLLTPFNRRLAMNVDDNIMPEIDEIERIEKNKNKVKNNNENKFDENNKNIDKEQTKKKKKIKLKKYFTKNTAIGYGLGVLSTIAAVAAYKSFK